MKNIKSFYDKITKNVKYIYKQLLSGPYCYRCGTKMKERNYIWCRCAEITYFECPRCCCHADSKLNAILRHYR